MHIKLTVTIWYGTSNASTLPYNTKQYTQIHTMYLLGVIVNPHHIRIWYGTYHSMVPDVTTKQYRSSPTCFFCITKVPKHVRRQRAQRWRKNQHNSRDASWGASGGGLTSGGAEKGFPSEQFEQNLTRVQREWKPRRLNSLTRIYY